MSPYSYRPTPPPQERAHTQRHSLLPPLLLPNNAYLHALLASIQEQQQQDLFSQKIRPLQHTITPVYEIMSLYPLLQMESQDQSISIADEMHKSKAECILNFETTDYQEVFHYLVFKYILILNCRYLACCTLKK